MPLDQLRRESGLDDVPVVASIREQGRGKNALLILLERLERSPIVERVTQVIMGMSFR